MGWGLQRLERPEWASLAVGLGLGGGWVCARASCVSSSGQATEQGCAPEVLPDVLVLCEKQSLCVEQEKLTRLMEEDSNSSTTERKLLATVMLVLVVVLGVY